MNQTIFNNLKELVGKTTFNPFCLWPNVTKQQINGFLSMALKEESIEGKSFIFERSGKALIYFQIKDLFWDTQHFGFKCAKINNFYIDEEIHFEEVEEIKNKIFPDYINYLTDKKIRFISADIASQSKNGNFFIQCLGFKFILNWIDGFWIPKQHDRDEDGLEVRRISFDEVELFSKIAATSYYKGGRFYLDTKFNSHKVDELYGELVKNAFISNDIILSCFEEEIPIGIFVCKQIKNYIEFNNLKVANLRFLLVNPVYRDKLYGYKIFKSTIAHLKNQCDLITSGLESHNLISLNLHSKIGFKFNFSHNAFHFWNL